MIFASNLQVAAISGTKENILRVEVCASVTAYETFIMPTPNYNRVLLKISV